MLFGKIKSSYRCVAGILCFCSFICVSPNMAALQDDSLSCVFETESVGSGESAGKILDLNIENPNPMPNPVTDVVLKDITIKDKKEDETKQFKKILSVVIKGLISFLMLPFLPDFSHYIKDNDLRIGIGLTETAIQYYMCYQGLEYICEKVDVINN